ncbi:hypothetical protein [Ekhidna sp.]|uniref:hypothetical protein n=1 Tax=Ekhidna sp. TaxID=2608089 RepID=UPI003B593679
MGLQDLIVTPIYLILLTFAALLVRPYVTNKETRKYFLPALWVRFAGAILLGILYQFYYGGGDTFNYWEHGSRWIYSAFGDDISLGIKLLLEPGGEWDPETFQYTSNIWYYRDPASYAVVKATALFDLITFHTYSATALFFAVFSFSGLWAMYTALNKNYPENAGRLAIAILFVPSVIFWGSGILKDSVTIGAIGWITWSLVRWIDLRNRSFIEASVFSISLFLIYKIKMYILICFLPLITVWVFFKYIKRVRNIVLKILVVPVLGAVFAITGFFTLKQVTEDSNRYQLDNIAERVRITAYDIRYGWGARTGGDGGYDIGLPDGSWQSLVSLAPKAINVSLFRPYIWEVRNPLMVLSALESLVIFLLSMRLIIKGNIRAKFSDPFLIFCIAFSMLFAFAVGVSTFNFGTLMRYKIPIMPFLGTILISQLGKNAKVEE